MLDVAEQRLGLALPRAVREWYEQYGARRDVWSQQDVLHPPEDLRIAGDVLILSSENQGVVCWGIRVGDLSRDDPPVVVSDPEGGTEWFVEAESTSLFAIQRALVDAKWSAMVVHRANGGLTDRASKVIEESLHRFPFTDAHWPAFPTRLHGHADLVVESHGDVWIWATARTRRAFEEIDQLMREAGVVWEHVSSEP